MAQVPLNIEEFNTIVFLVFAKLYVAFPTVIDIDRQEIAKAMGRISGIGDFIGSVLGGYSKSIFGG